MFIHVNTWHNAIKSSSFATVPSAESGEGARVESWNMKPEAFT
jgi:hypothetical protein